jgi:hypothetical protein
LSVRGHAAVPPEEEDEEEAIAMHPDRFTERVGADKSVVLTPMAWCSAASETGEWEMWGGWSSGGYATFEIWIYCIKTTKNVWRFCSGCMQISRSGVV